MADEKPVELEGCLSRLEPAEDCVILGTEDALCFFIFVKSLAMKTGAFRSLLSSIRLANFFAALSWMLSARLSSVPPRQLPVPLRFIFNKRTLRLTLPAALASL